MGVLEFLNGERAGQQLPLPDARAVLGRHPECDIVLDQGAVSRQHAQISHVNGEYYIEDLQSRNGTWVNGQAIQATQQLRDGDEVKICDLAMTFHRDSPVNGNGPATIDSEPFQVEEESETKVGHSSTVMWKMDLTSNLETTRLKVNPETKLRALMEITQNLSQATAIDDILPKVLDSLFNIFPQADRGFVVMCTTEGRLVPKAFKQRHSKEEGARLSRTIINEVIKQEQAILSADAATD